MLMADEDDVMNDMMNKVFEKIKENKMLKDAFEIAVENLKSKLIIRGEPDKSLKDALARCPDNLLNRIWNNTLPERADEGEQPCRKEKEAILYEEIPKQFVERLPLLSPDKLSLFGMIFENNESITRTPEIFTGLLPYGWCFAYSDDRDMCSFFVPEEVFKALAKIKEPQMQAKFTIVCSIRKVHEICIALYGAYTYEHAMAVLDALADEGEDSSVLKDNFETVTEALEEEKVFCRIDNGFACSTLDEGEIQELIEKRDDDWYHLLHKDIRQFLGLDTFGYRRDDDYGIAVKTMNLGLQDIDHARDIMDEICAGFVEQDWEMSDCMEFLKDEDIVFINRDIGERFIKALMNIYKNSRRWILGGYSRAEKETGIHGKVAFDIAVDDKKIYPNDLCPCGSGKKYKKCCGR